MVGVTAVTFEVKGYGQLEPEKAKAPRKGSLPPTVPKLWHLGDNAEKPRSAFPAASLPANQPRAETASSYSSTIASSTTALPSGKLPSGSRQPSPGLSRHKAAQASKDVELSLAGKQQLTSDEGPASMDEVEPAPGPARKDGPLPQKGVHSSSKKVGSSKGGSRTEETGTHKTNGAERPATNMSLRERAYLRSSAGHRPPTKAAQRTSRKHSMPAIALHDRREDPKVEPTPFVRPTTSAAEQFKFARLQTEVRRLQTRAQSRKHSRPHSVAEMNEDLVDQPTVSMVLPESPQTNILQVRSPQSLKSENRLSNAVTPELPNVDQRFFPREGARSAEPIIGLRFDPDRINTQSLLRQNEELRRENEELRQYARLARFLGDGGAQGAPEPSFQQSAVTKRSVTTAASINFIDGPQQSREERISALQAEIEAHKQNEGEILQEIQIAEQDDAFGELQDAALPVRMQTPGVALAPKQSLYTRRSQRSSPPALLQNANQSARAESMASPVSFDHHTGILPYKGSEVPGTAKSKHQIELSKSSNLRSIEVNDWEAGRQTIHPQSKLAMSQSARLTYPNSRLRTLAYGGGGSYAYGVVGRGPILLENNLYLKDGLMVKQNDLDATAAIDSHRKHKGTRLGMPLKNTWHASSLHANMLWDRENDRQHVHESQLDNKDAFGYLAPGEQQLYNQAGYGFYDVVMQQRLLAGSPTGGSPTQPAKFIVPQNIESSMFLDAVVAPVTALEPVGDGDAAADAPAVDGAPILHVEADAGAGQAVTDNQQVETLHMPPVVPQLALPGIPKSAVAVAPASVQQDTIPAGNDMQDGGEASRPPPVEIPSLTPPLSEKTILKTKTMKQLGDRHFNSLSPAIEYEHHKWLQFLRPT